MIAQQQIYISRVLKINLDTKDLESIMQGIERLAAEIQRSYDYYQSLWDLPLPSFFLFASTKPIVEETIKFLSQVIRATIKLVDITDVMICKPKLTWEEQGQYLPMIG